MPEVRTLRPGILVSIKTSHQGNRNYKKTVIEAPHEEGGVERSEWNTTKIVFDADEAKEAAQVANRARYIITRLCAETAHGPLCPTARRDELNAAIKEAREMTSAFNESAVYSRIEVNVICGEVVADDVEATRALFSETEKLMTQMQEALEQLDTKKIQQLCSKALNIGQMLSPDANADIVAAVNTARAARKKIVKAGEQAAIEIDRQAIAAIGVARNSFLDFEMDDAEWKFESGHADRALDFEPEVTEGGAKVPTLGDLDFDTPVDDGEAGAGAAAEQTRDIDYAL